MKFWGLLCVVLVATVASVMAAPEGLLPAEELPSAEPIDIMIAQRACTQPWCSNMCWIAWKCRLSRCTSPNVCTCYC